MYHSLAHSVRVGHLSDVDFRSYILLQCMASEQRRGGDTGLTPAEADWLLRHKVSESVDKLIEVDLIAVDEDSGRLVVPDWDERQSDSDSSYERVKRYRERIRNGGAPLPPSTISRILKRDGEQCVYCGSHDELAVDHLVPISDDGDNADDNLACACKPCNSSKKGRDPRDAGFGFFNLEAEERYLGARKRIDEKVKRYRNGKDNVLDKSREDKNGKDQEQGAAQKRASPILLKTYLQDVKSKGQQFIPTDDPIWARADQIGLPVDFVKLEHFWFRDKFLKSKTMKIDWRQHFRNAVDGIWGELWWLNHEGNFELTSKGRIVEKRRLAVEAEERMPA